MIATEKEKGYNLFSPSKRPPTIAQLAELCTPVSKKALVKAAEMASLLLVFLLITFLFLAISGEEKVTSEDAKVPTKDVSEAREGKQEGTNLMALAMIARANSANLPEYEEEEFSIEQKLPVTDENPEHMVQLEPETGIDVKAEDVEATNGKYNPDLEPEFGKDIEDGIGEIDKSLVENNSTKTFSTTITTSTTTATSTIPSTTPSTTQQETPSTTIRTESTCGIKSNNLTFIVCTAFILIFIW